MSNHTSTKSNRFPFDLGMLADAFNLKGTKECQQLEKWVNTKHALNEYESFMLHDLHQRSVDVIDYWNEEELKMHFISHLFYLANISIPDKISVYFERNMSAIIQEQTLSVKCDCVVATPKLFNRIGTPYFFLQEFKKGKGDKNDPEAQMLMAMLIAQHLNTDNQPIYGSYLIGQNWHFTTLINNTYCRSRQFDAMDKKDLVQIVSMLRALKELILAH